LIMSNTHDFNFKATGIGSVPSTNVEDACLNILRLLPDIPFWPQLVRRSPLEDMNIQFTEGLPLLAIDENARTISLSDSDMDTGLIEFYDHYLSEDTDYFAIGKEYAQGLHKQIDIISGNREQCGDYIKGHTVGPVTFSASVKGKDGKTVLSNPDLLEAFTKGLAIKALWQVKEMRKSGKRPIIFLDEPYLSGFGSAFSPIERQEVIDLLKEIIVYLRQRVDVLIGIHCCGNTDWSMIFDSGPDIVNFDAFSFMDYFLLYPEHIAGHVNRGGIIAWGIVPTGDSAGKAGVDDLYAKMEKGIGRLLDLGLDSELLYANSILTPACGMGTMDQSASDNALDLLYEISMKMDPTR
jgi:hypothetical protein